MSAHFGSDPWLDARLRNVPLPVGMLQRLSELANPADEELDAALRDVPLPAGLCQRLDRSPSCRSGRLPGCRRWARGTIGIRPIGGAVRWARQNVGWRELAIAASLLLAIGAGYLALARGWGTAGAERQRNSSDQPGPAHRWPGRRRARHDELAVDSAPPSEGTDDESLATKGDSLFPPIEFKPLPLPGQRVRRPRNLLFASDGAIDRLPPLELAGLPADRGLAPPLVAGYDLVSQLKTGERSFVAPECRSAAGLRRRFRSGTIRRAIARPAADRRRAAALAGRRADRGLPERPVRSLPGGRKSAGDSRGRRSGAFGRDRAAAVAGGRAGRPNVGTARPATDLTIAVDTSASMWHGQRLEMVRQALRRLTAELTPADRVTLIGFSDDCAVAGRSSADRRASVRRQPSRKTARSILPTAPRRNAGWRPSSGWCPRAAPTSEPGSHWPAR